MKILGICSSPREEGSRSEKLLNILLQHAKNGGAEVELVRLADKKIVACQGCYSADPKSCVYPCVHTEDDTNEVLRKIVEADALAVSTPVHWGAGSSLLATLIGKMTALENNHRDIWKGTGREPLLGKPFVLIASQVADGATMALSQINWAFNHMGMYCVPWGMIFEPVMLEKTTVRAGLRIIGIREFEWIATTIRLAAQNLIAFGQRMAGHEFDDYSIKTPRC